MPVSSSSRMRECEHHHPDALVPVWEDMDKYEHGADPDYLGCLECKFMARFETETGGIE